jgi:negative regulator of sigma E activity
MTLKDAIRKAHEMADNSRYNYAYVVKLNDDYFTLTSSEFYHFERANKDAEKILAIDGGLEYIREGGVECMYQNAKRIIDFKARVMYPISRHYYKFMYDF